jgi:hypothetical protein
MPRFFFDTQCGQTLVRDEEGLLMPDAADAYNAAFEVLPSIAIEGLPRASDAELAIVIRNDKGLPIFRAKIALTGERLF